MRVTVDRRTSSLFLRFADASHLLLSKLGVKLLKAAAVASSAHRFAAAMVQRLDWNLLVERKGWPIPQPERSGEWLAVDRDKIPAVLRSILTHAEILPTQGPDGTNAFRVFREGLPDCSEIPEPAPQDRPVRLVLIETDFWKQDSAKKLQRVSEIEALVAQDPTLVVAWQSPKHGGFGYSLASIFVQKLRVKMQPAEVASTDAATPLAQPEAPLHDTTEIKVTEDGTEEANPEPSDPLPEEDVESPGMEF